MTNKPEKIQVSQDEKLAAVKLKFAKDIEGFSKFILKDHITLAVPKFHKQIYKMLPKNKRVAIAAPRGHAKSTMVTLAYVLWAALNGKKFIIICSDTYPQAKFFIQAVKDELEHNELLRALYGNMKTERWAETDIELKNGVRIIGKGAEMKFRGLKHGPNRPDLIVVDDLENDEMVENKERRDKLERWFNGALIPSLDREGQIVYIGTILHDDALLMKVIHKYKGWKTKVYQAITNGKALWPEHLPLEELNRIKANYTENGLLDVFMAEYMNDPITDESREFKREFFKYYETVPDGLRIAITVDPAISKKTHADYSVIYVQGVDKDNRRYCIEYMRKRVDPYELCDVLFRMVKEYSPWCVGVEKVAYQEALIYIIKDEMRKRNVFFKVQEISTRTDKTIKIRGLVPMYRAGVMYHKRSMTELEEELLRFPKGRTDDILDAQAMMLELVRRPTPQYQPNRHFNGHTGY